MAVNTAKRKQEFERVQRIMKGSEFVIEPENYMRDLLRALNYYNINHDDKEKKKWFISYYSKIDKKLSVEFLKIDERHFRHAGILTRLLDGGSVLEQKESNYLQERIEFLKSQIKQKPVENKKVAEPTNVISIQERMEEKAHELAGEIDGAIDDFILNGCQSEFSTKNYLLANEVAAPIAKRIGEIFVPLSKELEEVIEGNDEQLVEGYSNFNKRELKRFLEFVQTIISDCQQQIQTAKANRSPRVRKAPTPIKLVSKMKFLREFPELKLKSVLPQNIIGSTEVWVYNTKYRRFGVYKAEGGTLSVKGTTISGFDIKQSKLYTLRKPEEFFKDLSLGKRALNNAIKTLTTKPTVPTGRINEEIILIGAF